MVDIRTEIQGLFQWLVQVRREIHRHPELSYEEVRTAALAAGIMKDLGLEVRSGIGRTGVVGVFDTGRPGPCLGLRADMDALPIEEATGHPWASTVAGKMHACGHDFHTAMLLGTARALAENPDFQPARGSVKFLFQPAEEGGAGAKAMIQDRAMDDPRPTAVYAAHVYPILETGQVGLTRGPCMASTAEIVIIVRGLGGHAAHPGWARDPIAPAAALILGIKKRTADLTRALVALCQVQAGTRSNIIPDQVKIFGTLRGLDSGERDRAIAMIEEEVHDIRLKTGCEVDLEVRPGYPMVTNDDRSIDLVAECARKVVGSEGLIEVKPSFGGEDMAYFLEQAPGALYRLGCRRPGEETVMLHSARFDPDENALPIGVEIFLHLIENFMGRVSEEH